MYRLRIRRHGRLLERFRQRRMRVTGPRHILAARPVLNRQHTLGDHLARIRPHDVDPQDPIRLRVRDELHQALGLQVRLGARVGGKGEGSQSVFDPLFLELRFVLAHPGYFRVRVHDRGDGAVIHVAVTFGDVFDGCDGFFFRLVGEHGAERAVTDNSDVRVFGTVLLINH